MHVAADDGLAGAVHRARSSGTARLLDELGGSYHEVVGRRRRRGAGRLRPRRERHPARARREPARRAGPSCARGSVINRVLRQSGPDRRARHLARRRRRRPGGAPGRAPAPVGARPCAPPPAAWSAARWPLVGLPLLTFALAAAPRPASALPTRAAAVPAAGRGRRRRRRAVARRSSPRSRRSCCANWYFTPPHPHVHDRRAPRTCSRWSSSSSSPWSSARFVDAAARRRGEAPGPGPRPRRWPASPARSPRPTTRCRPRSSSSATSFGLDGVGASCDRADDGAGRSRPPAAGRRRRPPGRGDVAVAARPSDAVARRSRATTSTADDRRVLNAFAAQLAAASSGAGCGRGGRRAERAGRGQRAAHRAAAGRVATTCARRWRRSRRRRRACCSDDVELDRRADDASSSQTIDEEADRLNALVGNLLDMSRLQAGALDLVAARRSGSRRSCPRALASLGDPTRPASRSTCPRRCPGARRRRRCSSGPSPTSSTTRCAGRPTAAGAGRGRRAWPAGRPARRRPRPGDPAADRRAGVPAVPAPRRPCRRRRRRARAGRRPGLRRGHGRRADSTTRPAAGCTIVS